MGTHISKANRYSVAVYQPKGFDLPELDIFKITRPNGKWIMPRDFLNTSNPLRNYREALYNHYLKRKRFISKFLRTSLYSNLVLCCWCPHEKAAQRQMNEFGSFVCHTSVIYYYLAKEHPEIYVALDNDRIDLAPLWNDGFLDLLEKGE